MENKESATVRVDKTLKKLIHHQAIDRGTTLRAVLDELIIEKLKKWKVL